MKTRAELERELLGYGLAFPDGTFARISANEIILDVVREIGLQAFSDIGIVGLAEHYKTVFGR